MAKGRRLNQFIPTNDRLTAVIDHCVICNEPNGFLTSNTPKFKAGLSYTSGKPCPKCKPQFDQMVDFLAAGGILVKCTKCGSVTVTLEIPEKLEDQIFQMPDGTRCLEIHGCANCAKEGDDAIAQSTNSSGVPTDGEHTN